jgi:hypothetical protein
MRLVIHAGLHKSGTSSVQAAWASAYSSQGPMWYPSFAGQIDSSHLSLFAPHLDLFAESDIRYMEFARTRLLGGPSLVDVLAEAVANGLEQLVLSSETLDQASARDLLRLGRLFADCETTVLFTVTRPVHRWCSVWQELVKHGLTETPLNAVDDITGNASLIPGRLRQLVENFPAARKIVRVIRTVPREASLAEDLAHLVGLGNLTSDSPDSQLNLSLGSDTELLRALNRAGQTLGLLTTESVEAFRVAEALPAGGRPALPPAPRREFQIPEIVGAAAQAELIFFAEASAAGVIELVDPHDELAHWARLDAPEWYRQIPERAAAENTADILADDPRHLASRLWEIRMRAAALEINLVETTNYYVAAETERKNLMSHIDYLQSEITRLQLVPAVPGRRLFPRKR